MSVSIDDDQSMLLQILAFHGLINSLNNTNFLQSEHFKKLPLSNINKEVLTKSGLGNPGYLAMILYSLLIIPKNIDEIYRSALNDLINDMELKELSFKGKTRSIDHLIYLKKAISSNGIIFENIDGIPSVRFLVKNPENFEVEYSLTISTSDGGRIMNLILSKMEKYLEKTLKPK